MSRTIAITGATGFAGRHTVTALLAEGYSLRALVRNPRRDKLPGGVEIVEGDLHTDDAVARLLEGADAVVHLAGVLAGMRVHDYFRVNAHGTVALAEAALRMGVRRFVHVSSLAAREPQLSPYAASKRAGEDAVAALADKLNAIIIRPPAVYGPGDRGTLPLIKELTRSIATIPGRRDARFSVIHVRDLARLVAGATANALPGLHEVSDNKVDGYGWTDLIAAGEAKRGGRIRAIFLPEALPTAVAIAAEILSHLRGKPGLINRGKVRELYHLDWVSREGTLKLPDPVGFAEGFSETLAWYREAGWLPRAPHADKTGAATRGSNRQ